MCSENVIEVENLTMGYNGRIVQQNLNFNIKKGEIFAILGGSGCGKSTLLKHLTGLYKPMTGTISIKGSEISSASVLEKRHLMQNFGVLYQSGALLGNLTLAENVSLPLEEFRKYTQKEREVIIDEKLDLVDLKEFRSFFPSEISGGMKKRAGLARAMALTPDLLFFDEPSAGLDPISSANLDQLILDLRDKLKTTMVIVTHELDSIYTVADRVIVLDAKTKTLIAEGDPRIMRDETKDPWIKEFLNRSGKRGN
ncbi:MAG: ATP-binding cassette domain-containing protein [Lentisphaeria bacterium]|nr:ATP-binding cassette domain-containing protein [Lentisphaeria bacterium]